MLIFNDPPPGSRELGYMRAALERGELVVIPTDTVYGLAALAASEEACFRLYDAKQRSSTQPIAVVCSSLDDLAALLPTMSERAGAACEVLLPGPYTLIVRNPMHAVPWLCGVTPDSIGVRVPENAVPLPPVAATSANLPGEPEITRVAELPDEIAEQIACGIDRGELPPGNASTVIDLTGWEWGADPTVLRDPAGRAEDALRALRDL
jgi:L-threonylcarbamoyladenylate synthase